MSMGGDKQSRGGQEITARLEAFLASLPPEAQVKVLRLAERKPALLQQALQAAEMGDSELKNLIAGVAKMNTRPADLTLMGRIGLAAGGGILSAAGTSALVSLGVGGFTYAAGNSGVSFLEKASGVAASAADEARAEMRGASPQEIEKLSQDSNIPLSDAEKSVLSKMAKKTDEEKSALKRDVNSFTLERMAWTGAVALGLGSVVNTIANWRKVWERRKMEQAISDLMEGGHASAPRRQPVGTSVPEGGDDEEIQVPTGIPGVQNVSSIRV